MPHSKYFKYNKKDNIYIARKGKGTRPTNQNKLSVLKKIAARLERLIEEKPDLTLTELQKKFTEEVKKNKKIDLKANGIDIAHNIAISAFKKVIVSRLNIPMAGHDSEMSEVANDILSTEDGEGKKTTKEFFDSLSDPNLTSMEKMKSADKILKYINRASRNLIPGHSSTNRSIRDNRDPHCIKKVNEFVEIPKSKKISESFAVVQPQYVPKARKTKDGRIESQSSSIDKNPHLSWVPNLFNNKVPEPPKPNNENAVLGRKRKHKPAQQPPAPK